MRVALISRTAEAGDAIGNQVAEKLAFFLERGGTVRVFLESLENLHPEVVPHAHPMTANLGDDNWVYIRAADLVCFEFGQHYSLLGLLPLLADGPGRVLIDYHGITPPALWGPHNREGLEKGLAHRGLAWCADVTLVHSRCIERELIGASGIPAERVRQIGLPVDPQVFCPGPSTPEFLQRMGLDKATVLLYVGRLAANKRVPLLVEVLGRLQDIQPPVHLFIAGPADDIYAIEAERCRKLARDLGVADRIHFLGRLSGERLRQAYRAAAALVIPSAWESFSVPVIEAMACGVPVVAARAFALPETVGAAGLTFHVDDAADCERQLRRVLRGWHGWHAFAAELAGTGSSQLPPRKHGTPPVVAAEAAGTGSNQLPSRKHGTQPAVAADLQSADSKSAATISADLQSADSRRRVAIVSFRYGSDFAGGAEWSLRRLATALAEAGHHIEIFTTCNRAESAWSNELPAGTVDDGAIAVHRFAMDTHDRDRHLRSYQAIVEANGKVSPALEEDYLTHSIHSARLFEALRSREGEFDAIITGPYLFGLTADLARRFPDKALLVPCFHDEPLARLAAWPACYGSVAGILYHSKDEQEFAQAELGINHPCSTVIGTWLDLPVSAEMRRSVPERYLLYCGRYSEQKELPRVFDFARRYDRQRPGRFKFLFIGQGDLAIPRESWARDLGFVSPKQKYARMAGADALLQLSQKESLSLVALEAWSLGTPVIAARPCAVLAGHIERGSGGAVIDDFESFAAVLDDLWDRPESWQERGRSGREYVRAQYSSGDDYRRRLETALEDMKLPLRALMCRRGLERARGFHRNVWRERFGQIVDGVLHSAPRGSEDKLEIIPRQPQQVFSSTTGTALLSVRIVNEGTRLHLAEGPARTELCSRVLDRERGEWLEPPQYTCLPGVLSPGGSLPVAMPLYVPATPGSYEVCFWGVRTDNRDKKDWGRPAGRMSLRVTETAAAAHQVGRAPFLDSARAALAEAFRLQRLPDNYTDVTEGWFARGKRWLKRKLLNNFKLAYVDVLSRQQSQINEKLVTALQEAVEWCGTLDHALQTLQARLAALEMKHRSAAEAENGQAGTAPPPCPLPDAGQLP